MASTGGSFGQVLRFTTPAYSIRYLTGRSLLVSEQGPTEYEQGTVRERTGYRQCTKQVLHYDLSQSVAGRLCMRNRTKRLELLGKMLADEHLWRVS